MAEHCYSAAEIPAASDRPIKRAATMATLLRLAIGRASERLASTAAPSKSRYDPESEPDHHHEDNQEQEGKTASVKSELEGVEEAESEAVVASETASSSGATDDLVEIQDEVPFELRVEKAISHAAIDDLASKRGNHWAFCDVLLQPDEYGLGLNLAMKPTPKAFHYAKTESIVHVASFRRIHPQDIGPAEASGKIQMSDILCSINGEQHFATLEAVANCIKRASAATSNPQPFLLLRFLRRTTTASTNPEPVQRKATAPSIPLQASELLVSRPDVAILIRELVMKNQSLEEQLLSSRLKQDEQSIQLDQLHTLYAKTQLENWPTLSIPKPFSRRGTVSSDSLASSTPRASLTSAAARLMGTNPLQHDVEFAVNAERERLTRQFEQQLEAVKKALEAKYATNMAALRAATDKKISMLEYGVKQLLTKAGGANATDAADIEGIPVEVAPHILVLRHKLLHRPTSSSSVPSRSRNCVLCLLSTECEAIARQRETQVGDWRTQIIQILDEHATKRSKQTHRLEQSERIGEASDTDRDRLLEIKDPNTMASNSDPVTGS